MEWVAALVAIATIVVLSSTWRRRHPSARPRPEPQRPEPEPGPVLDLDPADLRELTALGERLVRERRAERASVLADHVRTIHARGVPVRGMAPTRVDDQWLLRFADGSQIVVVGRRGGDPWVVVRELIGGKVALADHRYESGRLLLTLDAGARRPEFIALGEA